MPGALEIAVEIQEPEAVTQAIPPQMDAADRGDDGIDVMDEAVAHAVGCEFAVQAGSWSGLDRDHQLPYVTPG